MKSNPFKGVLRQFTEPVLADRIKVYIGRCEHDKTLVKTKTDLRLEEHYKMASLIAGIEYTGKHAAQERLCFNHGGVGMSLLQDNSPANVKKVCWLLHYSTSNAYTGLFGMPMGEYIEASVMDSMNVKYEEEEKEGEESDTNLGCVGTYCSQRINNFRSNIKERAKKSNEKKTSIQVNLPKDVENISTKSKTTSNSVVWVRRGLDKKWEGKWKRVCLGPTRKQRLEHKRLTHILLSDEKSMITRGMPSGSIGLELYRCTCCGKTEKKSS